jgi:hypothetical protein
MSLRFVAPTSAIRLGHFTIYIHTQKRRQRDWLTSLDGSFIPKGLLFVEHYRCERRWLCQQSQTRRNHAALLRHITGVADGRTPAEARHGCTWWGDTYGFARIPTGHHGGNPGQLEGSGNQSHGLRAERS